MASSPYTLIVTATDTPLLIVRLAQLLAKRGCAIRTLEVMAEENHHATITLTILQSSAIPRTQIVSQIRKLIDVNEVITDIRPSSNRTNE